VFWRFTRLRNFSLDKPIILNKPFSQTSPPAVITEDLHIKREIPQTRESPKHEKFTSNYKKSMVNVPINQLLQTKILGEVNKETKDELFVPYVHIDSKSKGKNQLEKFAPFST